MGRFTTKQLVGGLAAACMLAGGAMAQDPCATTTIGPTSCVDNLEHGGNLNNWGGYWYLYTTKDAVIKNAGPADIYGPMSFIPSPGTGRRGSISARLVVGSMGTEESGNAWTESYPELAMATMLTQDTSIGMGSDFNTATAVRFYARASKEVPVVFRVETIEQANSDMGNAFDFMARGSWDASGNPMNGAGTNAGGHCAMGAAVTTGGMTWNAYKAQVISIGGVDQPLTSLGGIFGKSQPFVSTDFPDAVASSEYGSRVRTNNAYMKVVTIGTEWKEYEVEIGNSSLGDVKPWTAIRCWKAGQGPEPDWSAGDLNQANWFGSAFEFKKERVTRIGWSIKTQEATGFEEDDWLDVDDISIDNFSYVAPDLCLGDCARTPAIPTEGGTITKVDILSNFDDLVAPDEVEWPSERVNSVGGYWYFYDDSKAAGKQNARIEEWNLAETVQFIVDGQLSNDVNDIGKVLNVLNAGREHDGKKDGAAIGFTMGPAFPDANSGQNINSFVGIGTNLYDNAGVPEEEIDKDALTYFNASEKAIQGFYFEYKVDGKVPQFYVEVEDKTSYKADNGEVYHLRVPTGTPGEWNGAYIYFNKLVMHTWADRTSPLNLAELAKIQFNVRGSDGQYGELYIDNVYWIAGTPASVRPVLSAKKQGVSGLRASYSRGNIGVKFSPTASIASGKIQVINTKGRVVATAPLAKSAGRDISASIGAAKLSTGMYFVRVNAKDVNGRKIVQQAPVSIVR